MAQNESGKKDEFHFVQLVLMFQSAAMQQMGKVQNPITQKIERNLDQAEFSIDMLEMIQNKTKNNLSENEKKFLEHTLFELRMNYLDEIKKDGQKKEEKASAQKEKDRVAPNQSKQEKGKQQGKESGRRQEGNDHSTRGGSKEKNN
ncbi:MAG: DUF1844 domain-containing protein [candidate division Zixibacteria bacterium]|nr:DUF1844 domain-containing protein [candidate division Zixibacteria bacterium]